MTAESPYKPSAVLDAMVGHRLPGGCDDCDAYQTMSQVVPGVYILTVHHDPTCPDYRIIVAGHASKARPGRTTGTGRP